MSNPLEEQLAEALAEFEETRTQLEKASAEAARISVTVTSKDRSVEATVGGQGELKNLRFPTSRYRNMAPAELAGTLMATITQARTEAASQLLDLYRPFGPVPGLSAGADGGFAPMSWDELLAPLREEGIEVSATPAGARSAGALFDELIDDETEDGGATGTAGGPREGAGR
ncbi:YbaB/EbfC family nucleoid-associated protein [Streptomyces sp. NPDC094448]|uniref:YbaB/EbfC family nucleoid-associated protein n=1 Tax=Streptomyces sp. NPDC094448 TaxID=3366063 RepID=UPI0037F5E7F3